jgi:pimeloyl-ACP methyl ester carboxylesterase
VALAGGAGLALLAIGGAVWQAIATRRIERQHPPPGRLVDVGGRRLHVHIRGAGSPTVVIEAGLSGASYHYDQVADGIAAFPRVCTYDRAGSGWSDPGPSPRSSQRIVEDLRTLLKNAGLEPPFLLVGHSAGVQHARLYASRHPGEVAGLVLVEGNNLDLVPDHVVMGRTPFVEDLLYWTAPLGTPRLALPFILPPGQGDPQTRAFQLGFAARTKTARAMYEEKAALGDWRELRKEFRPLGDKPVVVISRRVEEGAPEFERFWVEKQRALAGISTRGRFVMAATPQHAIQEHEPQIIVAAVREMVESLRPTRENTAR